MSKTLRRVLAALAVVFLACTSPQDLGSPPVVIFQLPGDTVLVAVNGNVTPEIGVTVDGKVVPGASLKFRPSDEAVATVDTSGALLGVKRGTTSVTVEFISSNIGGAAPDTSFSLNVIITNLTLSQSKDTLFALGESQRFQPGYHDAAGNPLPTADSAAIVPDFDLLSAGNAVSLDTETGLITAIANGADTVRATVDTSHIDLLVEVIQRADSIGIDSTCTTLIALTASCQLSAQAWDAGGANIPESALDIAWVSVNPNTASIDSTGLVTAGANGTATVVASMDNAADTISVLVQQVATSFEIIEGDQQVGVVGQSLDSAVSALVLDGAGIPVSGQLVGFQITSGGGSIFPSTNVTNDQGITRAIWTLGTSTADSQVAFAGTVDDRGNLVVYDMFHATAVADAPDSLRFVTQPADLVAGDPATPTIGVGTFDQYRNRVLADSSTVVSMRVAEGSGTAGASVYGAIETTIGGLAEFPNTTIDSAGSSYRLVATSPGLSPDTSATFAVIPGPVASVNVTSGIDTLVAIGDTVTLTATGYDSLGNVIPNATFTWSSSDTTVATVDTTGLATATGEGTTTIVAEASGGAAGTSTVTVVAAVQATLPFADDFSVDTNWTNESSGDFVIAGGQLNWTARRNTVQRMYVPIEPYTGDFQLEFDFQLTSRDNNIWLEVGLAESLTGSQTDTVNDPVGMGVMFGWTGGGTPYSAYYVVPMSRYSDRWADGGGFNYQDPATYVAYTEDAWYRARLQVVGTSWRITVFDVGGQQVGERTGSLPAAHGAYRYIYIGNPDHEDWPTGTGYVDNLSITDQVNWQGDVRVASVNVTPGIDTLVTIGDTVTLTATAYDSLGIAIPNVVFTWSSTDTSVATVKATGTVTAVDSGTALIAVVEQGGATDTATIHVTATSSSAFLTVLVPNGGEIWEIGNNPTISWSSVNAGSNVSVELYNGHSLLATVVSSTANDGSYVWGMIPTTLPVDTGYRIKVTDLSDTTVFDWSDNSFALATVEITSPNGGERWGLGSEQTITWTRYYSVHQARLDLYKGDTLYVTIADGIPNNGSYTWTIPAGYPAGSDYRLQVTDIDWNLSDFGDSLFALFPSVSEGLIAHYTFTANAADSSGNGHDGVVNGVTLTQGRFGGANNAYSFDGIDDHIEVADSPALSGMTELTVTAWVKVNQLPTGPDQYAIVAKHGPFQGFNASTQQSYRLVIFEGGVVFAGRQEGGAYDGAGVVSGAPLDRLGEWVFLAGVFDNGHFSVFIDDSLAGENTLPWTQLKTSTVPLIIGYSEGTDNNNAVFNTHLNGSVDDVRIYGQALTQEEIRWLAVDRPAQQTASEIIISPKGGSIVGIGSTYQFSVAVWDSSGNVITGQTQSWTSLNPNVATVEQTGRVTAVGSGQATIMATVDGVTDYAVVTVAVPGVAPVNLWHAEDIGTSNMMYSVWGTSTNDVFAVGWGGTIMHYDGTNWTSMVSPTSDTLRYITGTSASDIFAVGSNGTILHYDGTSWDLMQSGTTVRLSDVWIASPTNVYAVGHGGVLLHYDGTQWSTVPTGTADRLQGVWGFAANDVFVVGDAGTILHFDGTTWSSMPSSTSRNLFGVWGPSPDELYVVGGAVSSSGAILEYDGTTWTEINPTTIADLVGVWGTSGSDVYAGGGNSGIGTVIYRGDGVWNQPLDLVNYPLDFWGISASDVLASGHGVTTLTRGYRGATITVSPSMSNLVVGDTVTAIATAREANATAISGVSFTWASSDTGVATVDANGLVIVVATGTAIISATAPGGASGSTTVGMSSDQVLPFVDDFSSDANWTNESGGDYVFSGGQLNWTVRRNAVQRMYVPIEPHTGDFQLEFDFQLTNRANNVWLEVGLAESLAGAQTDTVNDPVGAGVMFGWTGGGTPYSVYYVVPISRYGDQGAYSGGFNYQNPATYVAYTEDAWYNVRLQVVGTAWRLTVFDAGDQQVGERTGNLPATHSAYRYIYLGNLDDEDWPTGNGYLDNLSVTDQVDWSGHAPVASVEVTPSGASISGIGSTHQFTAEARDSSGNVISGKTFTWTSLNPNVATVNASTGVVTAVDAGQVTVEAEVGGVVGYGLVTTLVPSSAVVAGWDTVAVPTTDRLLGIWGAGRTDAWIVGEVVQDASAGLHYDGTSWTSANLPAGGVGLRALWGFSQSDVWAVGNTDFVWHYDGTAWSSVAIPAGIMTRDVWGASPDDLWSVGEVAGVAGGLLHYDGNAWGTVDVGAVPALWGVWGSAQDDVWAVGHNGVMMHYDGALWEITYPTVENVQGVWGSSSGDVWAVGNCGACVWHFDGSNWSSVSRPGGMHLTSVYGLAPDDIYAAGVQGGLLHYDGTNWNDIPGVATVNLESVWGAALGDIFVVGDSGTVLRGTRDVAEVTSVVLTPDGASISGIGSTYTFSAEARDVSGNVIPGKSFTWTSLNPNAATVNTSTGVVTAVDAGQVTIKAEVDGVVGYGLVTVLVSRQGMVTGWEEMTVPTTYQLQDIWGAAPTDVWLVGETGDAPNAVLHYEGTSWVSADVPTGVTGLRRLWGTSANNIWAVGNFDWVWRYDGTSWVSVAIPAAIVPRAIWGSSPNDVWAVGELMSGGGGILHFDGDVWTTVEVGILPVLWDVWGVAQDDIWAVGYDGVALHFDGITWDITHPTGENIHAIWGSSATDVWAVGNCGSCVWHFNGSIWSSVNRPTGPALLNVHGLAANDIYAVGVEGQVLHYDGVSWREVSVSTGVNLESVWGSALGDLFVVGDSGTVLRGTQGSAVVEAVIVTPAGASITGIGSTYQFTVDARDSSGNVISGKTFTWTSLNPNVATVNASTGVVTAVDVGQVTVKAEVDGVVGYGLVTVTTSESTYEITWDTVPSPTAIDLFGIWGSSRDDVWVVGGDGSTEILHYDGSDWTVAASPTANTVEGIWGTSSADIWAVDHAGGVLRYDGVTWNVVANPIGGFFKGIWGNSPTSIWAVGQDGVIVEFDGTAWSASQSPTSETLWDIWGFSRDDVWAVGAAGTMVHFNGADWVTVQSSTTELLSSIWGSASNDIWAVSYGGSTIHYDGTAWSITATPAGDILDGLWGNGTNAVWATGFGGAILNYDGANWATATTPTSNMLYAAWGSSSDDVWVVGESGIILHGTTGPVGPVDDVLVNPDGASLSGIGLTIQFTAEARDASGNVVTGKTFTWTSLNPNVATIDASTGVVTAVDAGQVAIRAAVDAVVGYGLVTVAVTRATPASTWTVSNSWPDFQRYPRDVWGTAQNNVYVVGQWPPQIFHYDGSTWVGTQLNDAGGLEAVWGSSESDVFCGWIRCSSLRRERVEPYARIGRSL